MLQCSCVAENIHNYLSKIYIRKLLNIEYQCFTVKAGWGVLPSGEETSSGGEKNKKGSSFSELPFK